MSVIDGRGRRDALEGAVHFDGIELRGVIAEVICGFHSFGVESAAPARRCECERAKTDAGERARAGSLLDRHLLCSAEWRAYRMDGPEFGYFIASHCPRKLTI